jgi:hypothetical protein
VLSGLTILLRTGQGKSASSGLAGCQTGWSDEISSMLHLKKSSAGKFVLGKAVIFNILTHQKYHQISLRVW